MNIDNPFIHLFKTHNGYYLYDVNKNTILNIDESLYDALINKKTQSNEDKEVPCDETDNTAYKIMRLSDYGYLSSNKVSEIVHPQDEILEYHLKNKLCSIILQITQQCNFRCKYCAYSDNYENRKHSNYKMSFETAKKGIDFLISQSSDSRSFNVAFYGGEPLLEMEFIKKCIKYAEEKSEGRKITFSVTTNGSLLNEDIVEYFINHNVSLTISIDGPKEVHDKNRIFAGNQCGSFDTVMGKLDMIRKKYPDYLKRILFNSVMDPENGFTCVNEFFLKAEEFFGNATVMSSVINNNYRKSKVEYGDEFFYQRKYETFKLLLNKLGRLHSKYLSPIMIQEYVNLIKISEKLVPTEAIFEKGHHGGPCIPGVMRLFVNTAGELFPCERVSEVSNTMKIGDVDKGFDVEKVRSILNIGKITEAQCKKCWAFRFCGLCAAFADDLENLSSRQKLSNCNSMRFSAEQDLKDYCVMKEFGHLFDDENGTNYIAAAGMEA